MKKKKRQPIGESKEFLKACKLPLAMYSTSTGDTKRVFVGGCCDEGVNCLIFFKGNVDDIFAVREFLQKRDETKS